MTAVADAVDTTTVDTVTTIASRVRDRAKTMGGKVAMREKDLGIWQEVTWASYWDTVQTVGHLIEARLRCIVLPGQLPHALIGSLGQDQGRLGALERGLARSDDLRPGAGVDVGKLRVGDDPGSHRLFVPGDRFRIVDPYQHRVGGDVLPAIHRNFRDAPVDPRRDVEAGRVHLTLYQ